MDVYFADRRLADTCASEKAMCRQFGSARAKKVALRLQQLELADNLEHLKNVVPRTHALRGDFAGKVALDLDGPYRLIIEPLLPEDHEDSDMDWSAVIEVTVIEITDYH